jgi:glycosyltransferase involved in cell wall biosynthesis
MRVVAILATYNEERFIAACLENLFRQGIHVYLIDNDSTDRTVDIARAYLDRGLIGIENFPRDGVYRWSSILQRKEQLATTLEGDWFMHVDADEIYTSPRPGVSLAEILAEVDEQGYNAVNFVHLTFIPTVEASDHDHPQFYETMRWYYPFMPTFPHLIRAWKRQPVQVELAHSGGHLVNFPGRRLCPQTFLIRHYLFLSVSHAIRKYVNKSYDPAEVQNGWHGWRATLTPEMIKLESEVTFSTYVSDHELDLTNPRTAHCFLDESKLGQTRQQHGMQSSPLRFGWLTNSPVWRLIKRSETIRNISAYRFLRQAMIKQKNENG